MSTSTVQNSYESRRQTSNQGSTRLSQIYSHTEGSVLGHISRSQAGHTGPTGNLSGDAANTGYRYAEARNVERRPGRVAARRYQDDWRRLRSDDQNVLDAVNSRITAVLEGWIAPVGEIGLKGRNLKGPNAIRRSSAKPEEEVAVSY